MQQFFLIIHVLAAVTLIGLVLLQQGRGADAGAAFGSGASGTLFGARGPASFLTRVTAVLAAVFFLTSMALAYMVTHSDKRESVIERLRDDKAQSTPAKETSIPATPPASRSGIPQSPDSVEGSNLDIPAVPATDGQTATVPGNDPASDSSESSPPSDGEGKE